MAVAGGGVVAGDGGEPVEGLNGAWCGARDVSDWTFTGDRETAVSRPYLKAVRAACQTKPRMRRAGSTAIHPGQRVESSSTSAATVAPQRLRRIHVCEIAARRASIRFTRKIYACAE